MNPVQDLIQLRGNALFSTSSRRANLLIKKHDSKLKARGQKKVSQGDLLVLSSLEKKLERFNAREIHNIPLP